MKKSSNSDKLEFVCLTDENLERYIKTIPLDVEEITIWNYKMCLHPEDIQRKEYLIIPPLYQFTKLKSVRFYNERLLYFPGTFPQSVERVFFVSCIVNDKYTNACVYGNHLHCIHMYQSLIMYESPVMRLLQHGSNKKASVDPPKDPLPISPRRSSLFYRRHPKKQRTTWKDWFCGLSWFFKSSHPKISPQKEVEMIQYIPLNTPNIIEYQEPIIIANELNHPSLSSIQRFKKIYDLLISENIIKILMDDL
jgi:hypothetical protein